MKQTSVDVIIPYSEEYTPRSMLEEALKSVEKQSIETNPIVIEDDQNHGPAWARNQGLNHSSSQYVAFLDADDLWHEKKLERQLAALERHEVGLSVEGDCDGESKELNIETFVQGILFGDLGSLTSSILIDTNQVDARFCEDLDRLEDHQFMIEAAINNGVCLCNGPLVNIRKHEGGMSDRGKPELIYESRLKVADQLEQYSETEHYARELRQLAHYGLARQRQLKGEYFTCIPEFLRSLRYGIAIKPIGALGLTPIYAMRNIIKNSNKNS